MYLENQEMNPEFNRILNERLDGLTPQDRAFLCGLGFSPLSHRLFSLIFVFIFLWREKAIGTGIIQVKGMLEDRVTRG